MYLQGNPCRIVDLGVFKFKPAEKPKTGESPSVDRRNARGVRRNIRRRRQRLDKVKSLLEVKLLQGKPIDFAPCDLYDLRCVHWMRNCLTMNLHEFCILWQA